jgi:hypothetical protein
MVRDVSATLVATTTRRVPAGGGSKTFICLSDESNEYKGMMCIGTRIGRQIDFAVRDG